MEIIHKLVTAIDYTYGAQDLKTNIILTTVYFDDGSNLPLDGYWIFKVGEKYEITYTDGNPVTIDSVKIKTW